jgi:hypothetical protein
MVNHDGFKSRKFWLNVGSQVLVFGAGLLVAKIPALAPLYSTLCTTIVSICALYFTSNIAEKHVLGKIPDSTPSKK